MALETTAVQEIFELVDKSSRTMMLFLRINVVACVPQQ